MYCPAVQFTHNKSSACSAVVNNAVVAVTCHAGLCGITATVACNHSSASGPLLQADL